MFKAVVTIQTMNINVVWPFSCL